MSVDNRLLECRTAKGLTRPQLAKLSGLSKNWIYVCEMGFERPSIKIKMALSQALGMQLEDVFPGTLDPEDFPVRYQRLKRALTIAELSRMAGVDVDVIRRAEGGAAIKRGSQVKIADALGLPVKELFTRTYTSNVSNGAKPKLRGDYSRPISDIEPTGRLVKPDMYIGEKLEQYVELLYKERNWIPCTVVQIHDRYFEVASDRTGVRTGYKYDDFGIVVRRRETVKN